MVGLETEDKLFNFLKLLHPDLKRATDTFSTFDCYSEKNDFYLELKCRRTHYDNLLIEKDKFDRLKNIETRRNTRAYYVCSTPKGVWVFHLNKEPKWSIEPMPATTDFENKEIVSKVIGYFSIYEGKELKYAS